MIQLNLLPDVKLEFIRAQRLKRIVLSASILTSIIAIAILLLFLSVSGLQRKHLNDLTKDINSQTSKLQAEPQIDKVLTVQNQLQSLTTLHNQKPAVSRLFNYLVELTPTQASITGVNADFTQFTMTINGTADALSSVNKFVDTLKYTTYTSTGGATPITTPTKAFSNVVLSSFALNSGSTGNQAASFSITLSYATDIFDNTQTVTLSVPNITTTRSLDQPTGLFTQAPAKTTGGH